MNIPSREFNHNLSRVKSFAKQAPVIITNHNKPEYVLMSFAHYERLIQTTSNKPSAYDWVMQNDHYGDDELVLAPRSTSHRKQPDFSE